MKFLIVLILLSGAQAYAGTAMTCTDSENTLDVSAWSAKGAPTVTYTYSEVELVIVDGHQQLQNVQKTVSAQCKAVAQSDEPLFTCVLLTGTQKGLIVTLADEGDGTFSASLQSWNLLGTASYGDPEVLGCGPK